MGLINFLKKVWYTRNSTSYIKFLRSQGVDIGDNCIIRFPRTTRIDYSRPSLVTIGNNVDINMNFQILAHDWASHVFRLKYKDLVNSSSHVTIGSNIYFGTDVIVLKGVTIGDNCIIGAGSLVVKDIPSNSVAAGSPCKVLCSLDDYYHKRKEIGLAEAVEHVLAIKRRFGRNPYPHEMREEFVYFVNKNNVSFYESLGVPVKFQLDSAYEDWLNMHEHSRFNSFEDFVDYALTFQDKK